MIWLQFRREKKTYNSLTIKAFCGQHMNSIIYKSNQHLYPINKKTNARITNKF